MASPVTVLSGPEGSLSHYLFTLNEKKQLALEIRNYEEPDNFSRYKNHGTSNGVIINPASLSAVRQHGLVTVYGIAYSGPDSKLKAISMLSPIYNPISNLADGGKPFATELKAVAACDDGKNGNWVYYLAESGDGNPVDLVELNVKDGAARPVKYPGSAAPSPSSNLAAFHYEHQFVFFTNTDDETENWIYCVNTANRTIIPLEGTDDVREASPLAVTTTPSADGEGSFRYVILYFMKRNRHLGRAVGILRNGTINWSAAGGPADAPALKATSLITVATEGQVNYVYYIPAASAGEQDLDEYKAHVDSNANWSHG